MSAEKTMPEIRKPADYCREDWHCLICGAPKEKLSHWGFEEYGKVRCNACYFIYSLQIPAEGSKKRYVPKPKYNKRYRDVYFRAYLHFVHPNEIWKFMSQFSTTAQANNAMNRLDGGGAIARERASRDKR